eukprot:12399028-Karenia_brevis.AAC.1
MLGQSHSGGASAQGSDSPTRWSFSTHCSSVLHERVRAIPRRWSFSTRLGQSHQHDVFELLCFQQMCRRLQMEAITD